MMQLEHTDRSERKGWLIGPWNSDSELSIGYATMGIDEPHLHRNLSEYYLVAHGRAEIRVGRRTLTIVTGDVLQIEPGEGHTFISSSEDYLHFVIHYPGLSGSDAGTGKEVLTRNDLGL